MQRQIPSQLCYRGLLSLVILVANTGAPFNTSKLGRVFLDYLGKNVANQSTVRVRVVSQVGSAQGFRAVAGLAKGGYEKAYPEPNAPGRLALLRSPLAASRCQLADLAAMRPKPPLRC